MTEQALKIVKLCGTIVLENGGETSRAEQLLTIVCKSLGMEQPEVFALPTGFFVTVDVAEGHPHTIVCRIKKRSTDLSKLNRVNEISRGLASGELCADDVIGELEAMTRSSAKKPLLSCGAFALAAGFFAVLFGGGWFEFLAAAVAGCVIQFVSLQFRREDLFHFIISLLGGFIAALTAVTFTAAFGMGSIDKIIIGAVMPLFPGLAMTNAIRDTMGGDLVSGVSRAAEAVLVALAIAVGVCVVLGLYYRLGGAAV